MNNETNISKGYVYFTFSWQWIKDKQIIHRGTDEYGMLTIVDEEGIPVKMFGYELMNNNEYNEE